MLQRPQTGISLANSSRADNSRIQSCNPSIPYPRCSTYIFSTIELLHCRWTTQLSQCFVARAKLRDLLRRAVCEKYEKKKKTPPNNTIVPIAMPAMAATEKRKGLFASSRGRRCMETIFCTRLPSQFHWEIEKVLRS